MLLTLFWENWQNCFGIAVLKVFSNSEIIRCKCIPILLYGTEAFMLNKSDLSSLDFVITRLFMKLFRVNNIETVEFCQDQFGFDKPSVLWARRVRNFDSKFVALENAFCKLTLSL